MKTVSKRLRATALLGAANATDLEVMHWWTSGGEAAAVGEGCTVDGRVWDAKRWMVSIENLAIYGLLMLMLVFVIGFLLAALIDQEVWKAAKIDGIPTWKTCLFIVIPMMCAVFVTTQGVKEYNVNMAATILTGLVPLTVYFVSGRLFVRGIAVGP